MNASQAIIKPNGLEKFAYATLNRLGRPYQRQAMVAGKFCVDALFPIERVIVQFDGDYWHGNPSRYPDPDKRQARRMSIDKSQNAYFAKAGFKVIRVWESEIRRDPGRLLEKVSAVL